jgi:hypothetical protein
MSGIAEPMRRLIERHMGDGAQVYALSGDVSTRRYYRAESATSETLPSAVLAVYPEPFECARSEFVLVQRLLAEIGLPVPQILECDGPQGALLLEDLGDSMLPTAWSDSSIDDARRRELYRVALGQLVTLQSGALPAGRSEPCFRVAFDVEKLSWELHYFEKHFVEGLRGADLGVDDRATLAGCFHQLATEIASWPQVLCHRDFHSRNLMLHGGDLYWIDFQDARLGPAVYDLASLLRDSYVDLEEAFIAECAEEFRQRALPGEARDVFRHRFELCSVQRNLKALGTFGHEASVNGNPVYLSYVPSTLESARRNLTRYPELEPLHRVLAHHIEELL